MASTYRKQLQTVLAIETVIVAVACLIAYAFWAGVCDKTWLSCVGDDQNTAGIHFLILAIVRPFVFTPIVILARVAGEAFGTIGGTLMTAVGATLSCLVLAIPAKYLGKRLVNPWLAANLPATWQLFRTQDYKVVFATRLIPLVPFDILSIAFGVFDFRFKSILLYTFLGTIPEAYLYSKLAQSNDANILATSATTLLAFALAALVPLFFYEFLARKRGTGMWQRVKQTYQEILYEARSNNDIVKKHTYSSEKIPVLLLYGFFSSRKSLSIMERLLNHQGFEVITFNLGGLLGTFFTRDIGETAKFIDEKIKRQFERHGYNRIRIVAHSKGGLVALHWLLKLGGSQYCDRVITMGTPFRGTMLTYLALATPLGFLWRDVWQMRPGSEFLKDLRNLKLPPGVELFCLHSTEDRVAPGERGLFKPYEDSGRVISVPMNKVAHFEFLSRRDVAEQLGAILRGKNRNALPLSSDQANPSDQSETA